MCSWIKACCCGMTSPCGMAFWSWARAVWRSLVVLCVVSVFPAKRLGLMQSRMKWDSCGCWGRLSAAWPWEYMWHWSASAAKHNSVGRERREARCQSSPPNEQVSPRCFSFLSPEQQFNLTWRVYVRLRGLFFIQTCYSDLAFVTLSCYNLEDVQLWYQANVVF